MKPRIKDWSEKNGTDIFAYYSGSIIGTMYYYTNFKNIGSLLSKMVQYISLPHLCPKWEAKTLFLSKAKLHEINTFLKMLLLSS